MKTKTNMKGLLIGALMVITSYGAQSQTMEKDYYNWKQNDTNKWVGMRPFPIKPLSVKKTKNKVIIVFDRKELEKVQMINRMRSNRFRQQMNRKPLQCNK